MEHNSRFLALVNDAKSKICEIGVHEVADLIKKSGAHLVDTREQSEWNAGHAVGAMHLSKGVIERDIENRIPNASDFILCYCGGGFRSALVAENLQRMGYQNVRSIAGGWKAWLAARFPVTTNPEKCPRSPHEKMGGIVHLPRLIDKCRLNAEGGMAGYNYLTVGFDKWLLEFLCVEAKEFEADILKSTSDEEVFNGLKMKLGPGWPTENAIIEFNQRLQNRRPDSPDRKAKFDEMLAALPQAKRKIETYFDLIDLDEGRLSG